MRAMVVGMTPSGAKQKGRRLQNRVAALLRAKFGLAASDCRPAVMGENGADIHLSEAARARFPFAVECKNSERLNVWQALEQAQRNAGDGQRPILVFSRNRAKDYVVLALDDFLDLL